VISFLWFGCFGELIITQVGEGARVLLPVSKDTE